MNCHHCKKELSRQEIDLATDYEKEKEKILCIDCRLDFENATKEQTQREYQVFEEYNSNIFTFSEMKVLKDLLQGKKVIDENGIIAGRIKPRIHELLYIWFPKKKELEKIIRKKQS